MNPFKHFEPFLFMVFWLNLLNMILYPVLSSNYSSSSPSLSLFNNRTTNPFRKLLSSLYLNKNEQSMGKSFLPVMPSSKIDEWPLRKKPSQRQQFFECNDQSPLPSIIMDQQESDTQYFYNYPPSDQNGYHPNQNVYMPVSDGDGKSSIAISSNSRPLIRYSPNCVSSANINQNVYSFAIPQAANLLLASSAEHPVSESSDELLQQMSSSNWQVATSENNSYNNDNRDRNNDDDNRNRYNQQWNSQHQQIQPPLGIILGRPLTNNFDERFYVPLYYPTSWMVSRTSSSQNQPPASLPPISARPLQYSSTTYPYSYYYPSAPSASTSFPIYDSNPIAFESFVGQTFTLADSYPNQRHDSMFNLLQQLDSSLVAQKHDNKDNDSIFSSSDYISNYNSKDNINPKKLKSLLNRWKSDKLGKFGSLSVSLSQSVTGKQAMIREGSESIYPYHPYPLKHIGGPFYVGPPVIRLQDPNAEMKLATETSHDQIETEKPFATEVFMLKDDGDITDGSNYYYSYDQQDQEYPTSTIISLQSSNTMEPYSYTLEQPENVINSTKLNTWKSAVSMPLKSKDNEKSPNQKQEQKIMKINLKGEQFQKIKSSNSSSALGTLVTPSASIIQYWISQQQSPEITKTQVFKFPIA